MAEEAKMKYYDILWTYNDPIDSKINFVFIHIKKEIEIGFKKELIKKQV